MDSRNESGGIFVEFGVNAIITNHLEMFVGNVNDESFNEVNSRNIFGNQNVIFMSVVMESDGITVIIVYTGSGNNRSAQVSADIFDNVFTFRNCRFGIDIETVGTMFVDIGFGFFERTAEVYFHEIQKCGSERVAE